MASSWYFVKEGQRVGPMGREELDARIADGAVDGDTLVWCAGMQAWVKAASVAELGVPPPVPGATPPPLPAPQAGWNAGGEETREGREERGAGATGRVTAVRPGEYAGFGVRLAAKAVDVVVLMGVGRGVEWGVTRWVLEGPVPMPPDWAGFLRAALWLVSINTLVAMAYTVYFQSRYEGTPGKLMLGLRVVRADGSRVRGWRAFGRYWAERVSELTFFVGYVMAAFDEEKRALHDYFCDTRVVKGARAGEKKAGDGDAGREG